jgi:hypothetical protein
MLLETKKRQNAARMLIQIFKKFVMNSERLPLCNHHRDLDACWHLLKYPELKKISLFIPIVPHFIENPKFPSRRHYQHPPLLHP